MSETLSIREAGGANEYYTLPVGNVLRRGVGIWARYLPLFLVVAMLVHAPVAVAAWLIDPDLWSDSADTGMSWVGRIIRGIGGLVITGALTYVVLEALSSRRHPLGAVLLQGVYRLPGILFTSIYVGLATGIAACALVIPAFFVIAMSYVAVPATVVEGASGSFERSARLTDGSRWRVFGIAALLILVGTIVELFLQRTVPMLMGPEDTLGRRLVATALALPFGLIDPVMRAVCYQDLRQGKEGATADDLVKVFD